MREPEWERIEQIFQQAVELPVAERSAFLDRAFGDDDELRREVGALLAADAEAGSFLAQAAVVREESPRRAGTPRRTIGPYKLLRQIGEGGMSAVYLALRADEEYRQQVAIKVFAYGRERPDLLRRFRTERQILATLDHPAIARLLDGGTTEDGLPYIVMEHIEGEPIDRYCDRQRLTIGERLELFQNLCSAVHYAHQNLVVHRDLKPSNVLVSASGVIKLLDFGIAKLMHPELFPQTVQHTATGQRLMTPTYASPEQVQGGPVTTASDVYSLGVLLYRLLSGHLPYLASPEIPAEIERAVVMQEPQKPSAAASRVATPIGDEAGLTPEIVSRARGSRPERLRRRLAGDLDNIVLKALRKEPRRRYASVDQLSEDLRRYREGLPVFARPDTYFYRAGKFLRRHRLAVATAAAFVLLVLAFAVATGMQAGRIAEERDQARRERDKAMQVAAFLEEIFQVSSPRESLGESVDARQILERGAERIDRQLTGQPEIQAALSATIGNVYRNLGLYDHGEPLLRRSLAIRRHLLGEDHPEVADSLSGLGRLLRDRGELAQAEPLLRQTLELRRRALGDRHPLVAESLTDLGFLLSEAGDYAAAETLLLEALELRRQLPDGDPEELIENLGYLTEVFVQIDDLAAAERLAREALRLARQVFGEDHPRLWESMNNLAAILGIRGQHAEAEPYLRRAVELTRKLFGDRHPEVGTSLSNLGRLLQEKGDLEAAQELQEQGLAIMRATAGAEHMRTIGYLINLAMLLAERGDAAGAEPLLREALELSSRALGDAHAYTGRALMGLGALRLARGEPGSAEPLLRRSLAIQQSNFAPDHRRVADAESFLGQCLTALGRFEEAEALVLAAFEKLARNLGVEHRRTQAARDRVIALYEAWGRPGEAADFRKKKSVGETTLAMNSRVSLKKHIETDAKGGES